MTDSEALECAKKLRIYINEKCAKIVNSNNYCCDGCVFDKDLIKCADISSYLRFMATVLEAANDNR